MNSAASIPQPWVAVCLCLNKCNAAALVRPTSLHLFRGMTIFESFAIIEDSEMPHQSLELAVLPVGMLEQR
jgi:hypothetical protein